MLPLWQHSMLAYPLSKLVTNELTVYWSSYFYHCSWVKVVVTRHVRHRVASTKKPSVTTSAATGWTRWYKHFLWWWGVLYALFTPHFYPPYGAGHYGICQLTHWQPISIQPSTFHSLTGTQFIKGVWSIVVKEIVKSGDQSKWISSPYWWLMYCSQTFLCCKYGRDQIYFVISAWNIAIRSCMEQSMNYHFHLATENLILDILHAILLC